MAELIQSCPVCHERLTVSTMHCNHCGLSLQNEFDLNAFNYLSQEQMDFLLTFLKCQGNFKMLQEQLGISYPFAKKQLKALLVALNLTEETQPQEKLEDVDMNCVSYQEGSARASDIIKQKLVENSGYALVHSITGKPYQIRVAKDGDTFFCHELPITPPYAFSVFDVIVDCLLQNGGSAQKGNGRNYKLGEPLCDDTTVVGYIGKHYSMKCDGDSVFDPVFVLAAILDWAGIARNCRGYLELTAEYLAKRNS